VRFQSPNQLMNEGSSRYGSLENAQNREFQVGDRVDVHGETGVITRVKSSGTYKIRFHYGEIEVNGDDIEGIASHVPIENSDNPPTESELREKHAKNHSGKFLDCEKCEREISGIDNSDLKYPIYYCKTCDEGISKDSAGHDGHDVETINKPVRNSAEKCKGCGVSDVEIQHGYCEKCSTKTFKFTMPNSLSNSAQEGRNRYGTVENADDNDTYYCLDCKRKLLSKQDARTHVDENHRVTVK